MEKDFTPAQQLFWVQLPAGRTELAVPEQQRPCINALFELISRLPDPADWQLAASCLHTVFLQFCRLTREVDRLPLPDSRRIARFYHLLRKHIREEKSPNFYAESMGISISALNRHCKEETGKVAEKLIAEYLLTESERLLLTGNGQLKEIAWVLGFNGPAHFSVFFK
ncbi:MAG: helix-turn-helix transcriptional regulator [Mucilaginibacter sp.]|nr:helix-turn-helix transcriptional regulator [Mucilaginibacter sp.]